ncbi:acyloxyacyl hydrolase [Sphingomonas sp. AX6]|uniref:acyloxyacyl hydrolase n=1 Tax=Sphingomonas sp. AX6 TaxID=2653171 RepID=UPI0012F0C076|nr:acyloxyacyl hydrolase [Sphingomonas sp. AX6]VXC87512.1 Acyloxyacyl hydrolase [Sphingomonas sp. AX6]
MRIPAVLVAAALAAPLPAAAQEIWGGIAAHGVETPFTKDIGERGIDLQAGYRFAPVEALSAIGSPEPYVVAVVNLDGETKLLAAGLSWKLGDRVYVRPGIGIAIHDGPDFRVDPATNLRTDLGSRVLFEPELAVGFQASERLSIEASWIHVSHAQLFGGQNPGLDIIGVRANLRL